MGFLSKLLLALAIIATLAWMLDAAVMAKAGDFQPRILASFVTVAVLWSATIWSNRRDKGRLEREAMKRERERQRSM